MISVRIDPARPAPITRTRLKNAGALKILMYYNRHKRFNIATAPINPATPLRGNDFGSDMKNIAR